MSLIPGSGRSPGGGNANPFQYPCLENPYGQRSLSGYSPRSRKESNTAKATEHTRIKCLTLGVLLTCCSPRTVSRANQELSSWEKGAASSCVLRRAGILTDTQKCRNKARARCIKPSLNHIKKETGEISFNRYLTQYGKNMIISACKKFRRYFMPQSFQKCGVFYTQFPSPHLSYSVSSCALHPVPVLVRVGLMEIVPCR